MMKLTNGTLIISYKDNIFLVILVIKTGNQRFYYCMRKTNYSHILKYTSLFGGVQGLNIMIGLVRNKLVALILGPEGMGLISLFNSTVNLMSGSTNLGIPTSGVKNLSFVFEQGDVAAVRHHVKLIRSWSLLTAVLGTLLCFLLSPLLDRWTFTWGDHTLHFMVLSPVVGLLAITGGEMAILKALRRMRRLAVISVLNVVMTLITSVPIYYFYGESGIVPSLVLAAFMQMVITICYSYRVHPLSLSFSKSLLGEGFDMVKLGVAFVLAAVLGTGAEFVIRSYLNRVALLDTVGLYNSAYMIVVTYGGMIFASLDTEYFPRLSAQTTDMKAFCQTVCSQIEASLLLICPMLIMLAFLMPIVIPLLFSSRFDSIVGMAQIAVLALYFRAIYLPMAYMNLAKGCSVAFLVLEAISAVILVASVVIGWRLHGLNGIGYAMFAAYFLDFLITLIYVTLRFGFRLSRRIVIYMLLHLPLIALTYVGMHSESVYNYWVWCVLLMLVSAVVSVYYLLKSR